MSKLNNVMNKYKYDMPDKIPAPKREKTVKRVNKGDNLKNKYYFQEDKEINPTRVGLTRTNEVKHNPKEKIKIGRPKKENLRHTYQNVNAGEEKVILKESYPNYWKLEIPQGDPEKEQLPYKKYNQKFNSPFDKKAKIYQNVVYRDYNYPFELHQQLIRDPVLKKYMAELAAEGIEEGEVLKMAFKKQKEVTKEFYDQVYDRNIEIALQRNRAKQVQIPINFSNQTVAGLNPSQQASFNALKLLLQPIAQKK
jgi:hypothetical protein